jgi:hypothetical protein
MIPSFNLGIKVVEPSGSINSAFMFGLYMTRYQSWSGERDIKIKALTGLQFRNEAT